MAAVHKKRSADKKSMVGKEEKKENVTVSDVVIEATERIEVVEEVPEDKAKSEDPLSSFKEKMNEEERLPSDEAAKKNFMWPIIFIFIIALLMLGGVFLYKQSVNKNEKINVVTLSPTPTFAPIPTKAVDLTKYEIEIQNGSGISGEAGRQKTSLESEGFTISATGNADNSDYTETIIKAKKEVEKAFIDKLKSVLGDTFTLGESEVLPNSSSVPVVVIIGTKK